MNTVHTLVWNHIDTEDWDGDTSVDVLIGALQALVDAGKISLDEVNALIYARTAEAMEESK